MTFLETSPTATHSIMIKTVIAEVMKDFVTFNERRNPRCSEIHDDAPPIRFTLPMAAAIVVKSDQIHYFLQSREIPTKFHQNLFENDEFDMKSAFFYISQILKSLTKICKILNPEWCKGM